MARSKLIAILAEPEDEDALWLTMQLGRRGMMAAVVLPEELVVSSDLQLFVEDEAAELRLILASGLDLGGAALIVNRMSAFPSPCLPEAGDGDLAYAAEEWRAAIVAWFSAFPRPVIGRPTPQDAHGRRWPDVVWRRRAAVLGFPVDSESNQGEPELRALMLGERSFVHGEGSRGLAAACLDLLAAISESESLAGRFTVSRDKPRFLGIDDRPPLRAFGQGLVDALLSMARQS